MKIENATKPWWMLAAAGALTLSFVGCDVDVDDEGDVSMPEYEKVEDGNLEMPEYDVKGPEIETTTKEVEVPTGIKIPDEDANTPDDLPDSGMGN